MATGHIYISRDITFDEELFLFSKLHLNAGARLMSEVQLLPDLFSVPPISGHNQVVDPHANAPAANQFPGENFDVETGLSDRIQECRASAGSASSSASLPCTTPSAPDTQHPPRSAPVCA
jgi:hypothetical protein